MKRYTSAARMPLWKWILCLLAGLAIFLVLDGLGTGLARTVRPGWQALVHVALALAGLFLYAVWTNLTERRPVTELSLKRAVPDLGAGLLIGIGFFAAVTGLIALAGDYRITGAHFEPLPLLTSFCFFFQVAVYEEILFRGILFRLIDDRWNTAAAMVVSALLFGAVHLANPGASPWSALCIAVEAGLLLGAAYKFHGTLWLPVGIHWTWNFVQGNIFGFSVSGIPTSAKVFSAVIDGPDWLTGGRFGAEASVAAVVVGVLLTVILLVRRRRDGR